MPETIGDMATENRIDVAQGFVNFSNNSNIGTQFVVQLRNGLTRCQGRSSAGDSIDVLRMGRGYGHTTSSAVVAFPARLGHVVITDRSGFGGGS
jgi:hypothetical protein